PPGGLPRGCRGSFLLRVLEELDEAAYVRIAHHYLARPAAHGHDAAVGYGLAAGGLDPLQEGIQPLHLEADVAHADVGDARGHDRFLAILELDEQETGRAREHHRRRRCSRARPVSCDSGTRRARNSDARWGR